ncbi:MAG TPA: DMT family transporter [Bacteroidetes bacterium]|nr:DMT family transporter [Bacteroidota bacterium]HEX05140.1 DMT family transporter [Bacteroidota bacterium]
MGIKNTPTQLPTAPVNDSHRGRRLKASLMLVLLCMIWGMTFPITKLSVADTDPIQFVALRFGLASPILYMFLMLRFRGRICPVGEDYDDHNSSEKFGLSKVWIALRNGPLRNVWLRGMLIGLLLFAGFALQVLGIEHTTASRSGFFTGLLVVFTPPLAMLMRTSHTPPLAWLALIPAFVGTYMIADPETGGMNIGDWLTIGCAVIFALQMVMLEALSRSEQESKALTLAQIITVGALAIIWSVMEGNSLHITQIGWIGIAYTAVFGSVIAVWMQTRYQPDVPAAHAGFIFSAEPVFAALFAWMIIGDVWTKRGLFGAALILVAMGISSLAIAYSGEKRVELQA